MSACDWTRPRCTTELSTIVAAPGTSAIATLAAAIEGVASFSAVSDTTVLESSVGSFGCCCAKAVAAEKAARAVEASWMARVVFTRVFGVGLGASDFFWGNSAKFFVYRCRREALFVGWPTAFFDPRAAGAPERSAMMRSGSGFRLVVFGRRRG